MMIHLLLGRMKGNNTLKLNIMKAFILKNLNFIIELLMVIFLFILYGAGKNVVVSEDNENVLAIFLMLAWIGWLIAKYVFLGYKIGKDEEE